MCLRLFAHRKEPALTRPSKRSGLGSQPSCTVGSFCCTKPLTVVPHKPSADGLHRIPGAGRLPSFVIAQHQQDFSGRVARPRSSQEALHRGSAEKTRTFLARRRGVALKVSGFVRFIGQLVNGDLPTYRLSARSGSCRRRAPALALYYYLCRFGLGESASACVCLCDSRSSWRAPSCPTKTTPETLAEQRPQNCLPT